MSFLKLHAQWLYSFVAALILVGGYVFFVTPPQDFPSGESVVISRGTSMFDITEQLADANIIKSPVALRFILRTSGASTSVKSGTYLFDMPQNVISVSNRIINGAYGLPPVRITFPEGVTARDISQKVAEALPLISAESVVREGKQYEGYLFPDTYHFLPDENATSVIDTMRKNFDAKIAPLLSDIQTSGRSLSDVIIMASLVEKEARTEVSKRIVAGILWDRLALGIPLQVDAVFGYIFDRDTYSPSYADLKVDSPYNTYTNKGLPPGPISNPGLESINSALYPTKTKYLYYLSGSDNLMHYATTYAEHQSNRRKYLK